MSLIAELKRRSVFKVAAAYLVVGWLAIQVAATVAPQLDLPDWVPRLITFVLLLGFPVTLCSPGCSSGRPKACVWTRGAPAAN